MKILMVLTSHDRLGDTGKKTGFWLEEFAAPYFVFRDAGADITIASPKGGQPPLDPKSDEPGFQMLCGWAGGKMSGPSICTGALACLPARLPPRSFISPLSSASPLG
jgi:hypothetical protein